MKIVPTVLFIYQWSLALQSRPVFQYPEEWHAWKLEHGKLYSSQGQEVDKHLVWLSNKKYIEAHNELSDVFGYTLELNRLADLVSH